MSRFSARVNELLIEFAAGTESSTAFGPAATGDYGNQFPSQNDLAYAPGDARWPFGAGGFRIANTKKKKKKKKKKKITRRKKSEDNLSIPIYRRNIQITM